jgi:hypothetical protein
LPAFVNGILVRRRWSGGVIAAILCLIGWHWNRGHEAADNQLGQRRGNLAVGFAGGDGQ